MSERKAQIDAWIKRLTRPPVLRYNSGCVTTDLKKYFMEHRGLSDDDSTAAVERCVRCLVKFGIIHAEEDGNYKPTILTPEERLALAKRLVKRSERKLKRLNKSKKLSKGPL